MHEVLQSNDNYTYLHKDSIQQLQSAREYATEKLTGSCSFSIQKDACVVLPWSSSEVMRTLTLCAKLASILCEQHKISLRYKCGKEELDTHLRDIVRGAFSAEEIANILPNQHLEKYDTFLPEDLLLKINCLRSVPMDSTIQVARRIQDTRL